MHKKCDEFVEDRIDVQLIEQFDELLLLAREDEIEVETEQVPSKTGDFG